MRTPRLQVVDWTDAPADLNGLVRFAERRNMVCARVPSHFKTSLLRTEQSVSKNVSAFFLRFKGGETPTKLDPIGRAIGDDRARSSDW